jgi:hypothetical protein
MNKYNKKSNNKNFAMKCQLEHDYSKINKQSNKRTNKQQQQQQ